MLTDPLCCPFGQALRSYAENDAQRPLRSGAFAQELVGLQPDVIVTSGTPATVALQRETRTIPIVFAGVTDPVAQHIVARLDRPGGNITGFADFGGRKNR